MSNEESKPIVVEILNTGERNVDKYLWFKSYVFPVVIVLITAFATYFFTSAMNEKSNLQNNTFQLKQEVKRSRIRNLEKVIDNVSELGTASSNWYRDSMPNPNKEYNEKQVEKSEASRLEFINKKLSITMNLNNDNKYSKEIEKEFEEITHFVINHLNGKAVIMNIRQETMDKYINEEWRIIKDISNN
ncbi:hypothetical protein ACODG4_04320 [Vagococcus fluvialis]|uniref:hypothetical protein n=1 Tax=Vagococcus fluvialis TaxID=2738 RepID=UPI003B5AAFDB